ncbi:MAG: hypothetical protein ACK55I_44720, partial [bacterium]
CNIQGKPQGLQPTSSFSWPLVYSAFGPDSNSRRRLAPDQLLEVFALVAIGPIPLAKSHRDLARAGLAERQICKFDLDEFRLLHPLRADAKMFLHPDEFP